MLTNTLSTGTRGTPGILKDIFSSVWGCRLSATINTVKTAKLNSTADKAYGFSAYNWLGRKPTSAANIDTNVPEQIMHQTRIFELGPKLAYK